MQLQEILNGYGNIQVETLTRAEFVDASLYPDIDISGQPAIYREKDPLRFVLMASLAFGFTSPEEFLKNKKVLDVGCSGGQISCCMQSFAARVWLCDPDLANVNNPAKRMIDERLCIDSTIQNSVLQIPELICFFDLVTSFSPHPFPLHLEHFSALQRAECIGYYQAMVDTCRIGGELLIMPLYESDLGLSGGLDELLALLANCFSDVLIRKVTMPSVYGKPPFFSVFIVAKNKSL
jgi:hypothetical protein